MSCDIFSGLLFELYQITTITWLLPVKKAVGLIRYFDLMKLIEENRFEIKNPSTPTSKEEMEHPGSELS